MQTNNIFIYFYCTMHTYSVNMLWQLVSLARVQYQNCIRQPVLDYDQGSEIQVSNTTHKIQLYQLLLLLQLRHLIKGLFTRRTWVSRYRKGKTSLDLNQARNDGVLGMQWHQLDHMQTICTSLQTDNHTNTSSVNFYRPDALPDNQPSVKALNVQT